MRLAFVGTYGSGKTTLTKALSQLTGLSRTHGSPMRNPEAEPGKTLDNASPPELLQLVMRRFVERSIGERQLSEGFLSDGSVLHEWIYGAVRMAVGLHPPDTATMKALPVTQDFRFFQTVIEQFGIPMKQHARTQYDAIVHLPIEFPLPPGNRPINEHFRVLSDELLLEKLADQTTVPFYVVRGSVTQRLQHVVDLFELPTVTSVADAIILSGEE